MQLTHILVATSVIDIGVKVRARSEVQYCTSTSLNLSEYNVSNRST